MSKPVKHRPRGSADLAAPRLYLFQRGDTPCFALSARKYFARGLPREAGAGSWRFCQPIELHDLGSYYFEAAKLVARDGFCIVDLTKESSAASRQ